MKNKRVKWIDLKTVTDAQKNALVLFLVSRRLKVEQDKLKAKTLANKASYLKTKLRKLGKSSSYWSPEGYFSPLLEDLFIAPTRGKEFFVEFTPKGDYNESYIELLTMFTETQPRENKDEFRGNRDSVL